MTMQSRSRRAGITIVVVAALFFPVPLSRATALAASPQFIVGQREDLPHLRGIYEATQRGSGIFHVKFDQAGAMLSAEWRTPDGEVYGRGLYLWEPQSLAFIGRTVLRTPCGGAEGKVALRWVDVVVKEEIHVMDASEVVSKWTKPLGIDCATGELQFFQWAEAAWNVSSPVPDGAPAVRR
jgi:hypothetical protein